MVKIKSSSENIIPLPPRSSGEADIGGVGQLNKNIEKINTRMETVVIALLVAFIVALISVFGIFIDAYKFHAESYDRFTSTLNEIKIQNSKVKDIDDIIGKINNRITNLENSLNKQ